MNGPEPVVSKEFRQALKEMPGCAQHDYDPLGEKTVSYLCQLAEHQLALFAEGEEACDIADERMARGVRKWLEKWLVVSKATDPEWRKAA
jgi:hypothetical protein